ncbi:MAG: HAMP domain-containing sensor histidine kinase [Tepidisphaeraceae bacterium]
MRTPVTSLQTTIEVSLRRTRTLEQSTDVLRRCLVDVRHLGHLVESLLDVARVSMPDDAGGCDVGTLAREVIGRLEPLAQAKDIQLSLDAPAILLVPLPARRIASVLTNLIDNAIEYTLAGGQVRVSISVVAHDFQLAVADTGVGMMEDVQARVFDPFYRADGARSSGIPHMGLGLHLVRSHVTAMGGRIDVTSEAGRGSEFKVVMPLAASATDATALVRSGAHGSEGSPGSSQSSHPRDATVGAIK